ncbi:MAG: flavin reductase (NADH) [Cellvibrionaceae bacterium]|jgi:flavin reductase (NADH)
MQLAEGLRLGMRRLASSVCVVATRVGDARYAMTASSVTSLSDDPASLLVCINKTAAIQPFLLKGQPLSINILGSDQEDVSNKCAQKNAAEERFEVGDWLEHESIKLPYLKSAQAVFICQVDNENHEYGTHQIVIGRLTDVIISDVAVDPLIYADGRYQKII